VVNVDWQRKNKDERRKVVHDTHVEIDSDMIKAILANPPAEFLEDEKDTPISASNSNGKTSKPVSPKKAPDTPKNKKLENGTPGSINSQENEDTSSTDEEGFYDPDRPINTKKKPSNRRRSRRIHVAKNKRMSTTTVPAVARRISVKDGTGRRNNYIEDVFDVVEEVNAIEHRLEMDRKRTNRPGDIPSMNPKQLREEYGAMRKELQKFDEIFTSYYGRKPLTTDKEYLRPLYARYKNVKVHLEPYAKSGNDSHRKLNAHDRQSPRPMAPLDSVAEIKKLEENKKKRRRVKTKRRGIKEKRRRSKETRRRY